MCFETRHDSLTTARRDGGKFARLRTRSIACMALHRGDLQRLLFSWPRCFSSATEQMRLTSVGSPSGSNRHSDSLRQPTPPCLGQLHWRSVTWILAPRCISRTAASRSEARLRHSGCLEEVRSWPFPGWKQPTLHVRRGIRRRELVLHCNIYTTRSIMTVRWLLGTYGVITPSVFGLNDGLPSAKPAL